MALPPAGSLQAPAGRELMPHQARVIAAAAEGHRTFLLDRNDAIYLFRSHRSQYSSHLRTLYLA